MKNIYVTVKGRGPMYQLENLTDPENYDRIPLEDDIVALEEDGWLDGDLWELPFILEDVQVLVSSTPNRPVWEDDDEGAIDITKQKGKYIKTKEYFSKELNIHAPFYASYMGDVDAVEIFRIELEDDEEFDPKQVQLLKSDYELSFLPYGIVVNQIYYKGKKIMWEDPEGYNTDWGDAIIYDDEQPYA